MTKEEKARFDAAVQEAVSKALMHQQAQFAKAMEATMKNSLGGVDKANAALQKAQKAVMKELDAAKKARLKAEKEGEKMAKAYFEGRQKEFKEVACTELLRQLTRKHLEAGKKSKAIVQWLGVRKDFVDNISERLGRIALFHPPKPQRLKLDGNPKLRYEDQGRGGTTWFENDDTSFDMWWEFAGGDALFIQEIPDEAHWEAKTKLPLAQRRDILTFIGEQIVEDHISGNGSFIIGETVITFYAFSETIKRQ